MMPQEKLNDVPADVRAFLDLLRTTYKNSYRLRWKGTNIPRGAAIDGIVIAGGGVQNGIICGGPNNDTLGYYKRTKEYAGEGRDEHEMIVATDGILTPGVDQIVEQLRDFQINNNA